MNIDEQKVVHISCEQLSELEINIHHHPIKTTDMSPPKVSFCLVYYFSYVIRKFSIRAILLANVEYAVQYH